MPHRKRLRSVCHSIAHHAVSGVSFVHPHVLKACKAAGVECMVVNLLEAEPCPAQFLPNEPLKLSLRSLKEKFESILASEGFTPAVLSGAALSFAPDPSQLDDYCSICRATLTPSDDAPVECVVNYLGASSSGRD